MCISISKKQERIAESIKECERTIERSHEVEEQLLAELAQKAIPRLCSALKDDLITGPHTCFFAEYMFYSVVKQRAPAPSVLVQTHLKHLIIVYSL